MLKLVEHQRTADRKGAARRHRRDCHTPRHPRAALAEPRHCHGTREELEAWGGGGCYYNSVKSRTCKLESTSRIKLSRIKLQSRPSVSTAYLL